jgi:hypothetical protein
MTDLAELLQKRMLLEHEIASLENAIDAGMPRDRVAGVLGNLARQLAEVREVIAMKEATP